MKRQQAGWTKPIVLFVIIAAIVGGYIAYKYGIPYYNYREARDIIDDVAGHTYSRRSDKQTWFSIESSIENTLRKRLRKVLDIPSEDLEITVRKKDKRILIKVEWTSVIRFDLFDTVDHMDFSEERWARTN